MIFQTYWFVLFSLVFFALYWPIRNALFRRIWLLLGCLVFHYHFAGPAGVLPILILGVVVYLVALTRKRALCFAAAILCVGALVFYKYTHFLLLDALALIWPDKATHIDGQIGLLLPMAAPLAISFFTFEFIHYLMDVADGKKPIHGKTDFALFTLYFPSLVAGPIKRFESFIPNLHHGLKSQNWEDAKIGLQRFAMGAFKKIVIADNLTLGIDLWQQHPFLEWLSPWQLWLWFIALSARILFDFSGYSDMAIGLARMMGIKIPENFNYPYIATSLQDFWQRWHISLSSWIRDYIYIPLGGNRHGKHRQLLNALVAFSLCGLWHGAAWNFLLWGLWHGFGLVVNSTYASWLGPIGRKLATLFKQAPPLGWALTFMHVSLGWLLFFYEPDRAWYIVGKLFGAH